MKGLEKHEGFEFQIKNEYNLKNQSDVKIQEWCLNSRMFWDTFPFLGVVPVSEVKRCLKVHINHTS